MTIEEACKAQRAKIAARGGAKIAHDRTCRECGDPFVLRLWPDECPPRNTKWHSICWSCLRWEM